MSRAGWRGQKWILGLHLDSVLVIRFKVVFLGQVMGAGTRSTWAWGAESARPGGKEGELPVQPCPWRGSSDYSKTGAV